MLTYEEMMIEYAKGFKDKSRIYFIEHTLSTFNADVRKSTPFMLFPRQKVYLQTISEKPNVIAIKHRQCGITTVSSAWIAAQFVFCDSESKETVLAIANKMDLATQIVDKIRDFLLQVPRWYWGDEYYSPDPNSQKNKKDIFVKNSKQELELFNGCKVFARSSGENAARGISAASILIFDEAAFIENGPSVYASAVAASASVKDAKIIMVSTPNGKDMLYYNTYHKAIIGENNFTAVEFKWYQDLRYNRFLKWYKKDPETGDIKWIEDEVINKKGNVRYNEERWRSLEQEGWTPTSPWYEEMCKSFNNDSMRIAQELDVSFMGSSNNVVQPEIIEMHEKVNVREPLTNFKDPYVDATWFWKEPIDGHRYICACDASTGSSNDFTAIEIIDMDGQDENGIPIIEQVAEYHGKKHGDEVGEILFNYATMYNNAFVVVDCIGGFGDSVILTLMNLGYKNLYYDDQQSNKYMIQTSFSKLKLNADDRLPGFRNSSVRFQMLSGFAQMLKNNEFKVRSKRVTTELETWIFKGETGRMDHMDGMHDDTITCLAMGLFVMKYSFNKLENLKSKDAAILKGYYMNNYTQPKPINQPTSYLARPQVKSQPFYNSKNFKTNNIKGSYMWLFSKKR